MRLTCSLLLGLVLTGCGAVPEGAVAPIPAKQVVGTVDAQGWHGIWLPTMNVLSVPGTDAINPFKLHDARIYVSAQSSNWDAAVAKLSPFQRDRLNAVRQAVDGHDLGTAGLVRLFLAGTLYAPASPAPLADSLSAIATEPLGEGIDRGKLLGELLAELDVPGRITQGIKLTCESASTQILLAEREPAEYARLVAGLASASGTVTLANGDVIARVPDWASPTDGYRSLPSRLLQPAFATYGNGPLCYSNTTDKNSKGQSGLTDAQLTRLLAGVFDARFQYLSSDNSTPAQRFAAYQSAQHAGWDAPVWLNWATGHVVLAQATTGDRVRFDNPLGAIQSMVIAPFGDAMRSVYVPIAP